MLTNSDNGTHNEIISYEMLWAKSGNSPAKIFKLFRNNALPSEIANDSLFETDVTTSILLNNVSEYMKPFLPSLSINIDLQNQYPKILRRESAPLKFFYYKGDISLLDNPKNLIGISGSRESSDEGIGRAKRLSKELVKAGYTIVSGLAQGIDTAAHRAAIDMGGKTIAILGTPINQYFPAQNKELQDEIARSHLLISHVPFYRYSIDSFSLRRFYFPQRNKLIAALSAAVVVIEAGDNSGTVIQAKETLAQGKKVFVLNSCFTNPAISWPTKIAAKDGIVRVRSINDITAAA